MHWFLSKLGFAAGVLFMTASGFMNLRFMIGQGHTIWDSIPLAIFSVGLTLACALLPFFIGNAWQVRNWMLVALGSVLLAFCLSMSLMSALGFAAQSRGSAVDGREALAARYAALKAQRDDLVRQLEKVAHARASDVVGLDIERHHKDRLWAASAECAQPVGQGGRAFCQRLDELRAELAKAKMAEALRPQLGQRDTELAQLRGDGAGRESDPQARLVSRLLGVSVRQVRSGWEVMVAVLIEFGAAFLPVLSTARHPFWPQLIEAHIAEEKPGNRWIETARRNGVLKTIDKR